MDYYRMQSSKLFTQKRERMSLEHGAQLLQELIYSCNGKSNPIRMFSAKDLEMATNNYNTNRILGCGQYYTLYKGKHEDQLITIKKCEFAKHGIFQPRGDSEWCINETTILSQVNHTNILKLLGCCIETQVPMLVFEFAPNGSLSDHIYKKGEEESSSSPLLQWDTRLKIATEIADAVNYLHTATDKCILHRGIKSTNIFLDERYVAKLSGFGLSISIPSSEISEEQLNYQVSRSILSNSAYYVRKSSYARRRYTEKNEIYSFGVLLLELFTGRNPEDRLDEDNGTSLVQDEDLATVSFMEHFISSTQEERLKLVFESNLLKEGKTELLMAFAELAAKCLRKVKEERPTMKEVVLELRRIKKLQHSS